MERTQRRLTAIIAADVVGYARLMGVDETGTLAALRTHRVELIDPAIEDYGGRIVKTMGDGLLLEFPSVIDAVNCAIHVQKGMSERNANAPDDRRMVFRIGINLGDIVVEGEDIHGDGVNIAARLESIASPGGICISRRVYEDVQSRLGTAFESAGEQMLKNIARPVQVWHWQSDELVSSVEAIQEGRQPPLPEKPSIAVLPFQNMSGDEEQEFFVDGISDDIITTLSRSPRLFVIARNSTFTYKGKAVDVKQVGHELGVRFVLEGSARKAGNRVRVTAQLIDCTTGGHVWAEKYDATLEDIFQLQDDITQQVVSNVDVQILIHDGVRLKEVSTDNLSARDLTRKAYSVAFGGLTRESFAESQSIAEAAIALDPNSSDAHCALASALFHESWMAYERVPNDQFVKAHFHAERAAELEPRNEMAHWILGMAHLARREFDEARASLIYTIELNPNFAYGYGSLGTVLAYIGDTETSIANNEIAIRMNPGDPSIFFRYTGLALAHFIAERYEDAVEWANRSIKKRPEYFVSHAVLTAALACLGRIEEAHTKHR